jgi:hypothetical protein
MAQQIGIRQGAAEHGTGTELIAAKASCARVAPRRYVGLLVFNHGHGGRAHSELTELRVGNGHAVISSMRQRVWQSARNLKIATIFAYLSR